MGKAHWLYDPHHFLRFCESYSQFILLNLTLIQQRIHIHESKLHSSMYDMLIPWSWKFRTFDILIT